MNGRSGQLIAAAGTLAVLLGSVSCGNVSRTGRSPSFLVIDSLTPAPLQSDVMKGSDLGSVTLRMLLKDQGAPGVQTAPSELNAITVNRYHVDFVRADGRNVQGVDVPYSFDGAATQTVTSSGATFGFELVRAQAKKEAPLLALANGGGQRFISTIAYVTFFGQDLAGNEVSVTGTISVNFS
jgi:hypothetical protein